MFTTLMSCCPPSTVSVSTLFEPCWSTEIGSASLATPAFWLLNFTVPAW